MSSRTLLLYRLMSRLSFPCLCLDFGSIFFFLLGSLTAFCVPETLGFEFLATTVYVIFSCDLLLIPNPVLCLPSCLSIWFSWSCFYTKSQTVLVLWPVYVASGPWFCPGSSPLYSLHIWACPRSTGLGSTFFTLEIILPECLWGKR